MPEIYDQYSNGSFTRVLIGMRLDTEHKCSWHSKPCVTLVYIFTDTNLRTFATTDWCELALNANQYTPTGEKSDPLFLCRCHKFFTHLYVLKLQQDKWYVGITSRPEDRIGEHKSGTGAKWTKQYPVVELALMEEFETKLPECLAVVRENQKVFELCEKYDWDNVRGGDKNA